MRKSLLFLTALFLVATVSDAAAAGKGSSMFAIEVGQGTADLSSVVASTATPPTISMTQAPEVNVQGEYWYMFSDDYAVSLSGGVGFSSTKQEPNDKATTAELTNSHTSYRVRLGGDRVGQVGDRFMVFMGPGVEFFGGKAKTKMEGGGVPSSEEESSNTTRFGVSGRIGGVMKLSDNVGIVGRVGHTLGFATSSADKGNAKVTWWPSSFDAAWGLVFSFGGE